MTRLHVGCAQFAAAPGDKEANLAAIERLAADASGRGCRLVVFPEMALTGYLPPQEMPALAERRDGESLRRLAATAAKHRIAIACGFPEEVPGRDRRANTFILIGPDGREIGGYRKVHLWDTERAWCEPGAEVPVFAWEGVRISGWICYDTRFPELARLAFLSGAELCLVPTAWLGPGEEWELALRARALDNAFFVAGADLINRHPRAICRGLSMIAGPHGEVLARAEPGVEGVIDAVLDPTLMDSQRRRLPLRRDRVPGLYRPLVES